MAGSDTATFGSLLRTYRETRRLTQEKLAERAGLDVSAIGRLENGTRKPRLQTVEWLANALDLGAEDREALTVAARTPNTTEGGITPSVPDTTLPPGAPASSHVRNNNLPTPTTTFIGRKPDVEKVRERLLDPNVRLLTLIGPGGVGKTRLALEVAAQVVGECADGVFLISLETITDPSLVIPTVAHTLGLIETGIDPAQQLKEHLVDRRMLLVLDNFEQLMDAAPVVAELLAGTRLLKVLVTSRAPLRVRGEHEYIVQPLSVPNPRTLPPMETLSQYDAVRLFVERAKNVRPDFRLTNENGAAVAEICAGLDGLPLAIELAAARVRALTPQAMLARLASRLRLLTGGARDLPERQRTLRTAIDWSYHLLKPAEQALFAQLSVFSGGGTLEAIEAVCNTGDEIGRDVLEEVESLLEKSLLRGREELGGEPRYAMLETIREYACERLEESGAAQQFRRRHAEYFLALAGEAEAGLRGARQAEWFERLEEEHDNLRAALRWSLEHHQTAISLRLSGALWRFWNIRGHFSEGRAWLDETLSGSIGVDDPIRAKALYGAGELAAQQGDYDRAHVLIEESLTLARGAGDLQRSASALSALGNLAANRESHGEATRFYEEALQLHRQALDSKGVMAVLASLGDVALVQGDYERATALLDEALTLAHRAQDPYEIASCQVNLGNAALYQGETERAGELHTGALRLYRQLRDSEGIAWCLEGLAGVAGAQGEPERAARLWGAAEALREAIGVPVYLDYLPIYERHIATARAQLEEPGWSTAWEEGRAMSHDQMVDYALQSHEARH